MIKNMIRKIVACLLVIVIGGLLPLQYGKVQAAGPFSGGSGTTQDPWIITTPAQLDAVRNNLSAYYKLGSDIDVTNDTQNSAGLFYNSGAGWVPIGTSSAAFTGALDGGGNKIIGLRINRPATDYLGLFGKVASRGVVRNIGLESINVRGNNYLGGLVGDNAGGTISNVYVTTSSVSGGGMGGYVGGLAGYNESSGTISNAYAAVTVSGGTMVGGLVGYNSSTISNAYATGYVSGGGTYVGGLVGDNVGTISDVFATGSVSGTTGVGGLVGFNNSAYSVIRNAYATGSARGTDSVGGLIGDNFGGAISNAYATGSVSGTGSNLGGLVGKHTPSAPTSNLFYDKNTTGRSDTKLGVPKTTTEMKTQSTYSGWDFTTVWILSSSANNGYPVLLQLCTITYNSNGADGGTAPTDNNEYARGESIKVPGNTGNLVKTGYTFAGWNTMADGKGTSYAEGSTFKLGMSNATLYAKWTLNKYMVSFNVNGGSAAASQTVPHNEYAVKPTSDPTKPGYNFAGWYMDGTYATVFDFANMAITGDTTIYAKWTAVPNSTINPATGSFDKLISAQADVTTTMTLNGNTLTDIQWNGASIGQANFLVSGSMVTIKKEYLASLGTGAQVFTFVMSGGTNPTLTVTVSDTTLSAPTALTATAGNGQVSLSWSGVSGAVTYSVYQGTVSGSYGSTSIATVSGVIYSYTAEGLVNGTTYYFVVKASNAGGSSSNSNEASATPQAGAGTISDNANLSGLSLSNAALSPAFDASTTSYAANVANSVSSLTVTASVYDPAATVTVNGVGVASGQASGPISLSVGSNTITVVVTAQSGATKTYTITATRAASNSGSSSGGDSPSSSVGSGQIGFRVIIDGKTLDQIATGAMTQENKRTVLTAKVDAARLAAQLAQEGDKPVIVIPASTVSSDKVTVELTGDAVKAMEGKQAVLEVQTANGNYKLPAAQIVIDRLASQLGSQVKLSDIVVHVDIVKSDDAQAKLAANAAEQGKLSVIAPPVDFAVTASYNGQTVEVDKFSTYVERDIPLPDGVAPSKVTTATVLAADGKVYHVPTYIAAYDGKYYAVVNSLTNSTYALIWHPVTFVDMEGHWAKEAVNDMASRMVVNGVDVTHFSPNAAITRAEFAAMIVRALGLADKGSTSAYSDVKTGDWYMGAVAKAQEYGIIEGYKNGTFGPAKTISREESMAIIARAMKLAGIDAGISGPEAEAVLGKFADGVVSAWAKQAVATVVKSGIVSGSDQGLQPTSDITRAETAAIVQRLLKTAKLIDNKNAK
ncbi:hypothetical protein BC351_14130 [Paenibacillus ferrarius]|uniref:Uncharacterized protein n=1 Tax=Paenibacillus ferrarius TaxID=1469647 RepID=A0A1V4H5Y8_9BACL|nr:S-layer homology domain-containing protein [Paenibacillus ferrarius]OPH46621.1 hypothetical protein BC351_14130 [Paenibacillus ferrarius]